MKRILFFTENSLLTEAEQTQLKELNELAEKPYEVNVVNSKGGVFYGETERLIPCDFVIGSVPSAYESIPIFNPSNEGGELLPTQKIVTTGDVVKVSAQNSEGTATVEIVEGVLIDVSLSSNAEIIRENEPIAINPGNVQATVIVASAAPPSIKLPLTTALVKQGDTFQIEGAGAITANVTNNVLTFTQASV